MKKVTKTFYVTEDGAEFYNREDCIEHECICCIEKMINPPNHYNHHHGNRLVESKKAASIVYHKLDQIIAECKQNGSEIGV